MALTPDQLAAIWFLVYLVAPVVIYLVVMPLVWLVRKLRGKAKAETETSG